MKFYFTEEIPMAKMTPKESFGLACNLYEDAKKTVKDLSDYAKTISPEFSYEIAMRQFDMILQAVLLNVAVQDGKFVNVEAQFIDKITDYADVLVRVNTKIKEENSSWENMTWGDIEYLTEENKDKFGLIVANIVDEIAEDFTQYFAAIDVVEDRDYLEELQAYIIKISMLLSAVDGDDLDDDAAKNETYRGFAVYEHLFKNKWEKHMQEFIDSCNN